MNERITVVGARGFIGSAVAAQARADGFDTYAYRHDEVPLDEELGTVVYCSGVAWGAQSRPADAYEVHVTSASRLANRARYARFVYVSSTRVYDRCARTSEDSVTGAISSLASDTYILSKLAGESAVLQASPENRIVRCSNVYGASFRSGLFLSDILRMAAANGHIELCSSLESAKDYIAVRDVAAQILRLVPGSRERIYNLAAGSNTSHRALIEAIGRAFPVEVSVLPDAPANVATAIDMARTQAEFPFVPHDVCRDTPALALAFRDYAAAKPG